MTARIRSRGEEAKEIARQACSGGAQSQLAYRFRRLLIRWENALPGLPAWRAAGLLG